GGEVAKGAEVAGEATETVVNSLDDIERVADKIDDVERVVDKLDDVEKVVDKAGDAAEVTLKKIDDAAEVAAGATDDVAKIGSDANYYVGPNGKALPSQYKDWIGTNIQAENVKKVEKAVDGTSDVTKVAGDTAEDVAKATGDTAEDVTKAGKYAKNYNPEVILPSKPHTNGTDGHWETILDEVEAMKQSGEYEKIYVNKGLSNEIPDAKPNRRPDIMGVRPDGTIDQVEVPSKTDNPKDLIDRMKSNQEIIGKERAGTIRIRNIGGD
ncbi:hypothetical protein, partial [Butyrivibrio sp. INlla21]|uniref:hypothetical protein n=1 Tax=Butyrivibrio sp. INlla21 TaxID=1520811 RepID=UPI0008E354C7